MLSCLISLLCYAASVAVYYFSLRDTIPAYELKWVSGIFGFLTLVCLGAIRNGWLAWTDASCVSNSDWSIMPRDGQRAAISGRIEPLGDSILAPLSGRACVIYEYEISRRDYRQNSEGETESHDVVDFAGIGMVPCLVRGDTRAVELHGFPTMTNIETEFLGDSLLDAHRARRYLLTTTWNDCSGLKRFTGAGDMLRSLLDDERSIRRDWRMIKESECAWLDPQQLPDDGRSIDPALSRAERNLDSSLEDDEDDLLDDESIDADFEVEDENHSTSDHDMPQLLTELYNPDLEEKRIEAGEEVVVIGHFDSSAFCLKAKLSSTGDSLKIFRDSRDAVAKSLGSEARGLILGGLIGLIALHAVLALGLWIYLQNKPVVAAHKTFHNHSIHFSSKT
jgi:hypothetical protein